MKIITTPRELMDLRMWQKACDIKGMNPWAVNEGMPDDTEITLEIDHARKIGLIHTLYWGDVSWPQMLSYFRN